MSIEIVAIVASASVALIVPTVATVSNNRLARRMAEVEERRRLDERRQVLEDRRHEQKVGPFVSVATAASELADAMAPEMPLERPRVEDYWRFREALRAYSGNLTAYGSKELRESLRLARQALVFAADADHDLQDPESGSIGLEPGKTNSSAIDQTERSLWHVDAAGASMALANLSDAIRVDLDKDY